MSRVAPASSKLCFIQRVWKLRTLGFLLAGLAIAGVLGSHGAPSWLWVALFLVSIAWPSVAFARARSAPDPVKAEFSNLALDSVISGFWIAAMGFSVLPSVLIVAMLGIGHVVTRGFRFFIHGIGIKIASACAAALVFGFAPHPEIDVRTLTLLPFLVAYPMAVGVAMRQLTSKMQRQRKLLDRLVSTDGLTGLANRQHWEWCAEKHLSEAARHPGVGAALMMIDVDRFKDINDRYGHLVGDEVITTVAHTLRGAMRAHDAVGRYAGDEFAVVLPGIDAATAQDIAERFRREVRKLRFPGAPLLECTVSVGIAIAEQGWSLKEWIHSADHALYDSKRAGRDCVSLSKRAVRTLEAIRGAGDATRKSSSDARAKRSHLHSVRSAITLLKKKKHRRRGNGNTR